MTTTARPSTQLGYLNLLLGDVFSPRAYLDRHNESRLYVAMRLDSGITLTCSPAYAGQLVRELARVVESQKLIETGAR